MEELQTEELEELVQELEGESGAEESLPPDVEEHLGILQSGGAALDRRDSAEQLGRVRMSSLRIVRALVAAYESDSYLMVSQAAAESLRAPVHQPVLQQHPDLMEATERALQQRSVSDRPRDERLHRPKVAAEPSRRRKPVSNSHIGLMIAAGVVLLGIGIAGVWAAESAGTPRTWQAEEGLIYLELFSLLCILPGVALLAWALWNWLAPWGARNEFRRSMKETSAVVCRARRKEQTNEWGGHSGYKYFVTVSLQTDDVYEGSRDILLKLRVTRRIWKSLEAGTTVTIRYAAKNPRIALIQGEW